MKDFSELETQVFKAMDGLKSYIGSADGFPQVIGMDQQAERVINDPYFQKVCRQYNIQVWTGDDCLLRIVDHSYTQPIDKRRAGNDRCIFCGMLDFGELAPDDMSMARVHPVCRAPLARHRAQQQMIKERQHVE